MYSCQGDGWIVYETSSVHFSHFLFQSYGPIGASIHMHFFCVCVSLVCSCRSLTCFLRRILKGEEVLACVCVALSDRKVGDGGCIQRKDSCQGDSSEIERMLFSSGTASVNLSASLYDSLSLLLIWPFVEWSLG